MSIKDGIRMLASVDNSDHNVLIFSIDCNISQEKEKRHLCYNQADYNAMREFVKLNYLTQICLICLQVLCGIT